MQTKTIGPLEIKACTQKEAIDYLLKRLEQKLFTPVGFVNANLYTQLDSHEKGFDLIENFTLFNDGIALDLAAQHYTGSRFPDNNNGTDFTPALLRAVPPHTKIFLYGAREDVVRKTAKRVEKEFPCQLVGYANGYDLKKSDAALHIQKTGAEIILVAMGNPLQEEWIAQYGKQTNALLILGVGALFDFMSGSVHRAPQWVQSLKAEWLYRLAQEPKRLFKRYTIDMIAFFRLLKKHHKAL